MKKGFTLIELMVVISIIGLMSTIVLSSVAQARTKADFTRSKKEFESLANALELYRANNNGNYPAPASAEMSALVNLYLSSYIKKAPTMPVSLGYASHQVTYIPNTPGAKRTCGSASGNEGYVVQIPITSGYPNLYYNGGLASGNSCAFTPPK